jgi:cobalamin synthase
MFGLLAAVGSVYFRVEILLDLWRHSRRDAIAVLLVAKAIGIASMIAIAWYTRPVDDDSHRFAQTIRTPLAIAAITIAAALAFMLLGIRLGAIAVAGAYLIIRMIRGWFLWRRSGLTGDDLLASVLVIETFVFLLAPLRPS